jgi:dTMP kinase
MYKYPGLFVAVEGIDGTGKSTAVSATRQWLVDHNIPHIVTKEPGGTEFSNGVRSLYLSDLAADTSDTTRLLLMSAARRDHVEKVIVPALKAGMVVVTDRYTLSTRAYQRKAEHLDTILEIGCMGLHPDLTILLDAPVEVTNARLAGRSGETGEALNHLDLAADQEREECRQAMLQHYYKSDRQVCTTISVNASAIIVAGRVVEAIETEWHKRRCTA